MVLRFIIKTQRTHPRGHLGRDRTELTLTCPFGPFSCVYLSRALLHEHQTQVLFERLLVLPTSTNKWCYHRPGLRSCSQHIYRLWEILCRIIKSFRNPKINGYSVNKRLQDTCYTPSFFWIKDIIFNHVS